MKKLVLASALLLSISSAQAAESVRWDSASISYQSVDVTGTKLTGFGVSGTKLLGEDFFITGSYSSVSDELDTYGSKVDLDYSRLSAGVGYRHAIYNNTDVFGIVSYQDWELDTSSRYESQGASDNGYGLQVGIRSLVTENIELSGAVAYLDIGEEAETGINVSAMYHFTSQFSVGAGYEKIDKLDTLSLSAVFFF
jgi:hypothetical protein